MIKIFVNDIIKDDDTLRGAIVIEPTIQEALNVLLNETGRNNIPILMEKSKNHGGFYFFSRYHQFVVFFRFDPGLGITIELIDFTHNVNAAFDYMLKLRKSEWKDKDREKIISIAQEIKDDKNLEKAVMVIKNPIQPPSFLN